MSVVTRSESESREKKKKKTAHLHLTFALPGTQINDLKTENSGPLSDPEKIAECVNIHFTNVGPKLTSEILMVECDLNSVDSQQRVNSTFELKEVTTSDVFKKLQEANVAKATGHDNIPNKILKIAAPVTFESLANLFNLSITTNTFPDHSWKVAKVFPLFKSGERNDPSNFRPISVLQTVELLVYEQMYTYLTENNLIQPRQSGFRSLHSTVTGLLDMTIEINGVLRLIEV